MVLEDQLSLLLEIRSLRHQTCFGPYILVLNVIIIQGGINHVPPLILYNILENQFDRLLKVYQLINQVEIDGCVLKPHPL